MTLSAEQRLRRAENAREWRRKNPEKAKEHARRTREKNKDKIQKRQAEWRSRNRERLNASAKQWYEDNKDRVVDAKMRRVFNITLEEYEAMLALQNGRCAICLSTDPGKGERFAVDHDRSCCSDSISCGKCIRGLLCVHCNVGLGHFRDNSDLLTAAIGYLLREDV